MLINSKLVYLLISKGKLCRPFHKRVVVQHVPSPFSCAFRSWFWWLDSEFLIEQRCGWDGNDYISLRATRGNFSHHQQLQFQNLRFIPKWKTLHKYKDQLPFKRCNLSWQEIAYMCFQIHPNKIYSKFI